VPAGRWLRRFAPRPDAKLQLVCFPHAGGSAAAYREWAAALPDQIEAVAVQYPGRSDRYAERPYTTMAGLADAAADALAGLARHPYAVFGHSMGAAVAYETILRLRSTGHAEPARLVVSGREAPQHSHHGTVHLHGVPALLAELARLGGTPVELLRNPEMRDLMLSTMAADCQLVETYRPTPAEQPLRCPITAMVGDRDPVVTTSEAADWTTITSGTFDLTVFPGEHFYLVPQRRQVLQHLAELLRSPARPDVTTPGCQTSSRVGK
jgi:pyochelin biosynthetic protein PchC